jgi:hypothetical protein
MVKMKIKESDFKSDKYLESKAEMKKNELENTEVVKELEQCNVNYIKAENSLIFTKNVQIVLIVLLIIVLGAGLGGSYFLYSLNTDLGNKYDALNIKYQDLLENPDKAAQIEIDMLVSKVAELISVPTDEKPTVATVQDKEALKDQAFFANAANGDKVIIYSNAKKAILYRPSNNRIIEVAPLVLDTTTATENNAITTDTVGTN